MFSSEICKIFESIFFTEHLLWLLLFIKNSPVEINKETDISDTKDKFDVLKIFLKVLGRDSRAMRELGIK